MSRAPTRAAFFPPRALFAPTSVLVSLAVLALLAAAGGCDDRPTGGGNNGPTTSRYAEREDRHGLPAGLEIPVQTQPTVIWSQPFPPTDPKPGYARGRVVGQNGKPINIPGIRITIQFYGISHESAKKIEMSHDIAAADGQYEVKLEPGTYRPVEAVIEVPFEKSYYKFNLHPLQETFGLGQESSQGLAQDFQWRLTGLKPKQPNDPNRSESWYGGTLVLRFSGYREDLKMSVPRPPDGTKVSFSLTPLTPMADNSPAHTITFERNYSGPLGLDNPLLTDIPLARYKMSGQEIFPDGRTGPVLLLGEGARWTSEIEGTFASDLQSKGVERVIVRFTRPIE
jgi:hypothetical protein